MADRDLITEAMRWKYGAKCSKGVGMTIDVWEHPTEPKPTGSAVQTAVDKYKVYVSSGQQADDEKTAKFEIEITKALGLTMKEFMNEIMAGRVDPITNAELETKFKSHL
ncbi:MAG: hypothetical protein QF436_04200 [Candidatus Woesearchaeota archaeon]|jgi:hypothetical protein|nr:hypothetical protein [Candidatus Woesearchaeota archaeon]